MNARHIGIVAKKELLGLSAEKTIIAHLPRETGISGNDHPGELLLVIDVGVAKPERVRGGEGKPRISPPRHDVTGIRGRGGGIDPRFVDEHPVHHPREGPAQPLAVKHTARRGHRHALLVGKRAAEPVGREVRFLSPHPLQPLRNLRDRGRSDLGAERSHRYRNPSCHALMSLLASQPE